MKRAISDGTLRRMAAALLFLVATGVLLSGCDAINDFNSYLACQHYCAKNYECLGVMPDADATENCINNCRNSIEFNCGDENQQAANDHIEECVDLGCPGFWTCMVFDSAPECYGFVTQ